MVAAAMAVPAAAVATAAVELKNAQRTHRYGGSRAAQWLLYHRLPDPRAKPSGDHADNRLAYRELCVVAGRLGGRLAATNASVRVMKDLLEAVG